MPSEGESPSAGWREVYDAMGVAPSADERLRADGGGRADPDSDGGGPFGRCPDCKVVLGAEPGDLCCEAYLERVRSADGDD